jgi:hypothetical protein
MYARAGAGPPATAERNASRQRFVLGNADPADCPAWARDLKGGGDCLFETDTLEHGVDSKAVSQLTDSLDGLFVALAHDVGCSEVFGECDSVGMAAQDDDSLSTETFAGDHAAETYCTVANDCHGFAA